MQYDEALTFIHSLGRMGSDWRANLESLRRLCRAAGDVDALPGAVHIAGTNGKGSTAAMTACIIEEAAGEGIPVGKYISPYIERFNERISVSGADIGDTELAALTEETRRLVLESGEPMPLQFAFVTLMAFTYFKRMGCAHHVIECGMGGLSDHTNVLAAPEVCVITEVGYDHTEVLGRTLGEIAANKAGIVKPGCVCVRAAGMAPEAAAEVDKACAEAGARLVIPDLNALEGIEVSVSGTRFTYKGERYSLRLLGEHQAQNALCAIEAALALHERGKLEVTNPAHPNIYAAIRAGLARAYNPARLEILSENPLLIFDGAHNASGIAALERAIKALLPGKRLTLVCGMLADKEPELLLRDICALAERVIIVPVDSPRSADPEALCRALAPCCKAAEWRGSAGEALDDACAGADAVVSFGSLYLSSEVRAWARTAAKRRQ